MDIDNHVCHFIVQSIFNAFFEYFEMANIRYEITIRMHSLIFKSEKIFGRLVMQRKSNDLKIIKADGELDAGFVTFFTSYVIIVVRYYEHMHQHPLVVTKMLLHFGDDERYKNNKYGERGTRVR